jgi:hypothetical protein
MVVVRYATLLALVVWLGVMQCALLSDRPDYADWLQYVCGGVLIIGLFAMKFLGPPPRAFVARVAIVCLMLCTTAFDQLYGSSIVPMSINAALGLTLLAWYDRE